MTKFKIGDKVRCIEYGWSTDTNEVGKIFTIKNIKIICGETEIMLIEPRYDGTSETIWSDIRGFELTERKITNWRDEFET